MFPKYRHIHFVGIGGIGMSGIAELLVNLGYQVSGSDLISSDTTKRLENLGCKIFTGHDPANQAGADIVVYSSAVREDNVEVAAAKERGVPVIPRAEMLAELMRLKYSIAVAGAHGKTTTTSVIAHLLGCAGFDPTAVIGGKLNALGSNARLGKGEFIVAEADESDRSFLLLNPTIVVITNIDAEHLDKYRDIEEIKSAFLEFINKVPFYGSAIICFDNRHVRELMPHIKRRVVTYGLNPQADVHALNLEFSRLRSSFDLFFGGKKMGRVAINMPGRHNVSNFTAAAAVATELDINFETIKEALESFSGVQRRFQVVYESDDLMIIDDYGHHPEEIKATIAAAREGLKRRLLVAFQPHRYTRTKYLFDQFLTAFDEADELFITEIYPAGETAIEGVSARKLFEAFKEYGYKKVHYFSDMGGLTEKILKVIRPGDILITLGAGNIWKVAQEIEKRLSSK